MRPVAWYKAAVQCLTAMISDRVRRTCLKAQRRGVRGRRGKARIAQRRAAAPPLPPPHPLAVAHPSTRAGTRPLTLDGQALDVLELGASTAAGTAAAALLLLAGGLAGIAGVRLLLDDQVPLVVQVLGVDILVVLVALTGDGSTHAV